MPFLELALSPLSLVLPPVDHCLATQQRLSRNALLHLTARGDGTHIILYHLTSDREVIEATLAGRDDVRDWELVAITTDESPTATDSTDLGEDTTPSDETDLHAFIHLAGAATNGHLVDLAHKHALIIDPPLTFDDESVCATFVRTETSLQHMLGSIPEALDCSVRDAGEYDPAGTGPLSRLTDRQREVLATAVDHGYYDVPRRVTHRDLAGTLDCAPSTVDEHLRKAESAIIRHLF